MSLQPKPLQPGHYLIVPKGSRTETLLIGPVPIDAPDVPVKVNNHPLIERWLVKKVPNTGKYAVYSKRDRVIDYKWIADSKKGGLYVSSLSKNPGEFTITPEGDGDWRIIYGDNSAVTFVKEPEANHPQLIFTPWEGKEAQKFKFTSIEESYVE